MTPKSQDRFDHDKGQKSAFSGRSLHWILVPSIDHQGAKIQDFAAYPKRRQIACFSGPQVMHVAES